MSQHDRGAGRRSTLKAGSTFGAAAIAGLPVVGRGKALSPQV